MLDLSKLKKLTDKYNGDSNRAEMIVEYKDKDRLSFSEIGRRLNISKQCAWSIYKRNKEVEANKKVKGIPL